MSKLLLLSQWLEKIVAYIGKVTICMLLLMVLCEFTIVIMRYVFSYGSIMYQEAIFYMHGFVIMLSSAYTLQKDGHVRVDIFYSNASERTKSIVDLLGSILFLIPFSSLLLYYAFPYAKNSISVLEGSSDVGGIQGVFLLKSAIVAFSVLLILQGVAMAINSLIYIFNPQGKHLAHPHEVDDSPI